MAIAAGPVDLDGEPDAATRKGIQGRPRVVPGPVHPAATELRTNGRVCQSRPSADRRRRKYWLAAAFARNGWLFRAATRFREGDGLSQSKRPLQRLGIARAVVLMSGHAVREVEIDVGRGVLMLGSGFLPLTASMPTRAISRPAGFASFERSEPTNRLSGFLQVSLDRSAQLPEGVGSSRPLVS